MQDDHLARVATAFDRKAVEYDRFGEDHPALDRIRHKVYDHIGRWHPQGSSLLELNAGTGLDACRLVQRGYTIYATDLSPAMVAATQKKIDELHLADRLTVQRCDFHQLDTVSAGPFDGIISNSGGLNCTDDLRSVIRQLPRLLNPGGVVTWVIMPPICPWELALLFKDFRVATRRLRRGGTPAHVAGVHFQTYYHRAKVVEQAFGNRFQRLQLEGIAVVTPTADNKRFAKRYPGLYRRLCVWDDWLSRRRPCNGWGDFYALTMRYRGT